jgi:hypothetical protein
MLTFESKYSSHATTAKYKPAIKYSNVWVLMLNFLKTTHLNNSRQTATTAVDAYLRIRDV